MSTATSNWRFARQDSAAGKYTCRERFADGLFQLTDLNGKSSLIRRCACARGSHVLNESSPANAADFSKLNASDWLDPREVPARWPVGGTFSG